MYSNDVESVDKILWCLHLNETSSTVRPFAWYNMFSNTLLSEMWDFCSIFFFNFWHFCSYRVKALKPLLMFCNQKADKMFIFDLKNTVN